PFSKGGDWFLSIYFHPHLASLGSMMVYHENTLMLKNAVILSGAFSREDPIFYISLFFKNYK
ncbi:MAG TPA: hypothetical protein DF698_05890, partial [Candidatus Atribacteria bacterium]|nr:hypothetical protein [Candidatus Atribacteria bacterium]